MKPFRACDDVVVNVTSLFKEGVEEKLILAVTDNPVIYDMSLKGFHLCRFMSCTQTLLLEGTSSLMWRAAANART